MAKIIEPLLSPLTKTGVVVIFVAFILLQREVRLAGSGDIQRTTATLDDAGKRLKYGMLLGSRSVDQNQFQLWREMRVGGPSLTRGQISRGRRLGGRGPENAWVNSLAQQTDSAEAALAGVRNKLTDGTSNLTDFRAVQRVRGDIPDMAQSALQSGHGNKAPLLGGILRRLDEALENASERYLAANRRFAQASRDIEAVQAGGDAAMRGRIEDTVPAFRQLSAREYLLRVSVWVPSLSLVELVGSIWILLARQGRRRWALFPRNSPLMP